MRWLKTKLRFTKKGVLTVVGVLALVLLAAGVGVLVRWLQQNEQSARDMAQPSAVQQKVSDVQNLAVGGDYDAAHKQVNEALQNKYLSNEEKYFLTAQQGTIYENERKYQEALTAYQEAEAIQPTQDVAESIGRVAEAMGNKDLAIASYKQAIARISKDSPIADADKDRYGDLIRNLGGQP